MVVGREDLERSLARIAEEVEDPRSGLFAPDSISWAINREVILFLGGGRAALLQLAHPFVAHAVDRHSATRHDVQGRFRRTFENVYAMSFGELDAALSSARRVHAVHSVIRGAIDEDIGPYPAGTPYAANEPEALLWVYATLVDSAVMTYELVVRRLTRADKDRYLAESHRFARLFGIPDELLHDSWACFSAYVADMVESDRLDVGRPAAEMAKFLLAPPTRAHVPLTAFMTVITAGLLPPRLQRAFDLRFGLAERLLFETSTRALRNAYRTLPARLRQVPAYVEADRRVRGLPPHDRFGRAVERLLIRSLGRPSPA